jgi:probable rRNA maturation factor
MAAKRVSVALRCAAWADALPRGFAERVVGAVLDDRKVGPGRPAEVGVVLADDPFIRRLNRDHRGKDKPTNVLSFPLDDVAVAKGRDAGAQGRQLLLGDVVLAYRTIRREAKAEKKRLASHAAHMLVHGTLHLLGFDHERARAARIMEGHEVRILKRLGVPDPYRPDPYRMPAANGDAR